MYTRSAIVITAMPMVCLAAHATEPDRIVIVERGDNYELTVPVSRLVMTVPKKGFSQKLSNVTGATASRRYFHFENVVDRVTLTGWFESQDEFPGITPFWKAEMSAWSRDKLPQPADVVFKKLGGWEVITYHIPRFSGSNAHIRAHWLEAGTWIDLHLSVESDSQDDKGIERLEKLLAQVVVTNKK